MITINNPSKGMPQCAGVTKLERKRSNPDFFEGSDMDLVSLGPDPNPYVGGMLGAYISW